MNTQPFDLSDAISTSRYWVRVGEKNSEALEERIKYHINNVIDPALQKALGAEIDTEGKGCCELYYEGSTISVYPHGEYLWDIEVYQDEVLHNSKPKREPIITWKAVKPWDVQQIILLILRCYT
jgi:hypothetical protein